MTSCFLSTLSLRRATLFTIGLNRAHGISIHALLAESDAAIFFLYCAFPYFYPRSPCGERRRTDRPRAGYCSHFYPRSPCGERPCGNAGIGTPISISIHALLAESDAMPPATAPTAVYFYPRSPCGERRGLQILSASIQLFLSTLSLRRATISARREARESIDFYPRSPCGERQSQQPCGRPTRDFYPRSPCGERQ